MLLVSVQASGTGRAGVEGVQASLDLSSRHLKTHLRDATTYEDLENDVTHLAKLPKLDVNLLRASDVCLLEKAHALLEIFPSPALSHRRRRLPLPLLGRCSTPTSPR